MEEIKCNQVATLSGGKWAKMHDIARRVYGLDGLAPTIHTIGGGNLEPKIMEEPIALDEQNNYIRADGTIGALTTDGSSPKHNNRVIEPIVYDDYNGRIKADQSTINTLTGNCGNDAERNGVKIIEPTIWGSLQEHCAVKKDGICPTLPGAMGMGGGQIPVHNYGYRIRKLTPKETWRLMGFDDEDVEKAKSEGISNSQLYKQAGNSIVVNVLMAIFKEMI